MSDNDNYPAQNEQLILGIRSLGEEEPAQALRSELHQLNRWLSEISEQQAFLFIKRLSANDTGATGSHQVGLYLPDTVTSAALPSVNRKDVKNPDLLLPCYIESKGEMHGGVRAIYYNNKFFGGTRNEARLTRWAIPGADSPLKDPDNTGALAIFAFITDQIGADATSLRVWVCNSPGEEELVEHEFGEILPGQALSGFSNRLRGGSILSGPAESDLALPAQWSGDFPSGRDILDYVFSLTSFNSLTPDERVMKRRELEYRVFKQVELGHVMPLISGGFQNVDDFISVANSISNRRKSRSGHSLELHLRKIFSEEGLPTVGEQCVTENNKKPDFLFPHCKAYHDDQFPASNLRMLGVKTTCKDRWRQILSEAARIEAKHLFTLQEGVSMNQHSEMKEANVTLVVPKGIHQKYPGSVKGHLMTLAEFITDTMKSAYG